MCWYSLVDRTVRNLTVLVLLLTALLGGQPYDHEIGELIPEKPDTLLFDPETGELVLPESEIAKTFTEDELRHFIRSEIKKAGLFIKSPKQRLITISKPSGRDVVSMARADAKRDLKGGFWTFGGGLASCGAMLLCGEIGGGIAEFPGFLIGAAIAAFGAPEILSRSTPVFTTLPAELSHASPEQREQYRQAYIDETYRLRKKSIRVGEFAGLIGFGIAVLMIIFTVDMGP